MASNIPFLNYVGLLQEKCNKFRVNPPEYTEGCHSGNNFTYTCKIENLTTEGDGVTKKAAKQNAAKAMLEKAESDNIFKENTSTITTLNIISKLNMYSINEKKSRPLFGELPEEKGIFVFSCSFEGFTAQGRGATRKIAKEKAAEAVSEHFNLFKYYEDMTKLKERKESLKHPISVLNEYCQTKNLNCNFNDIICNPEYKTPMYIVTCTIGELQIGSAKNTSKKLAKFEAATKMLNLLDDTKGPSPDDGLPTANSSRSLDLDNK